jgi:hypothetical protein
VVGRVLLAAAGTEVPAADILVARMVFVPASGTEAVLEQLLVLDGFLPSGSASIFVQVSSVWFCFASNTVNFFSKSDLSTSLED